jgi:benzoyl-CoA reductase/2-hydroxyglutaryl-CoA dehydratase subunit BcrC/BadD/HgdB
MRPIDANTIGLTATVPVEVLLAAGATPLDLNNAFIASEDPSALVAEAEHRGFPINCCAWIKGIYAAVHRLGIRRVIGVAQGDCSNTHALMEVLVSEGIDIIDFNYPYPKDKAALAAAIDGLARRLGTTREAAETERRRLAAVRRTMAEIDRLTWRHNKVDYARRAGAFLAEAHARAAMTSRYRVGCLGIPPICSGLHAFLEDLDARVVFNEFQRQFSMPTEAADLVEQYDVYTYPYGTEGRIADIRRAVRERRLDALVHYVQSFCFRHIQDRLLREAVDVPILTLEFDRPLPLDGHSRTRIEAFVEMLDTYQRAE